MPHTKHCPNAFLALIGVGLFVLIVVMILLMTPVRASTSPDSGLPAGYTCEMVREKVAEHGRAAALAWALKQGYSFAQIRVARRCLK